MEIIVGIIILGGILVFAYSVLNKEKPDGSHPLDSVTGIKVTPVKQIIPEPTPAPEPDKKVKPVAKKQPAKIAAKTTRKKSPAKTTGA